MNTGMLTEFQSKGVVRRGILLLPPVAALEFVQECRGRNVELLGFDGFRLLPEDWIQPDLQDCLDLSTEIFVHLPRDERLRLAELFIRERIDRDIYFEMVVDDLPAGSTGFDSR